MNSNVQFVLDYCPSVNFPSNFPRKKGFSENRLVYIKLSTLIRFRIICSLFPAYMERTSANPLRI